MDEDHGDLSVHQHIEMLCGTDMGRHVEGGGMGTSHLEVKDIQCVGLTSSEGSVESINASVTVQFSGTTKTTQAVQGQSNPQYGEVLVFDTQGHQIAAEDTLHIEVKDGETLLGTTDVNLKSLSDNTTTQQEYSPYLSAPDGTQLNSKVRLRVELVSSMDDIPEDVGHMNDVIIKETDTSGVDKHISLTEDTKDYLAPSNVDSGAESEQFSSVEAEDCDSEEFEDAEPLIRREHNLPDKQTFFQVRVRVLKACNLPGSNIDSSIRVTVGGVKKQTKSVKSSRRPFFNENFFFDFNLTPTQMFESIISIEAYNTKGVLPSRLLGSFTCDVGMVYFREEHSVVRKWILLSNNEDQHDHHGGAGSASGFVQINAIVLGPGDELPDSLKSDTDTEEGDDVESNCWMPSGLRLQPANFLFKVYRAEDLPHKTSKNRVKDKKDIKCDTYCKFIFAGRKGKTRVKRHSFDPEFNEEVAVPFRFPSMCETLQMQLLDWNKVRMDNMIGNNLLSLSEISSLGNRDFLPSFGPCFINFYGTSDSSNTNRMSIKTQHIGSTTDKVQVGDDYKGRVLVEICTLLGKHSGKAKRNLEPRELLRIKPYLERKKYKLFTTFVNANLISKKERGVRFEVTIGKYGSASDLLDESELSSILEYDPVYDGIGQHFIQWEEAKPCCVVDCHWEDISFRLEPMNMLRNIAQRLERNINVLELAIKLNIKVKAQDSEISLLIIRILDHFIGDCNNPLPQFTEKTPGITKLDLKMQEIRIDGLEELGNEAKSYREDANDIHSALEKLKEFLKKLKTLCTEPQNSLPDVVISMMMGNKRIAYYRMPSEDVLYSKNQYCKGMYCGKQQNVILKYTGKKENDAINNADLPGSLNVITWLGLEEDQSEFLLNQHTEGKYAMYAETYENQSKMPTVGWTAEGCPRPPFSNEDGDVELKMEDFIPPQGWVWDGDWFVDPEIELTDTSPDTDETSEFTIDIWEVEVRSYDGTWSLSEEPYTNEKGDPMQHKDNIPLPEDWTDWAVYIGKNTDHEGWEYKKSSLDRDWTSTMKHHHLLRRRRLQRKRVLKPNDAKVIDGVVTDNIGWSYTSSFGKKFHAKERKKDSGRRRKWKRRMIVKRPDASPVFSIHAKEHKIATIRPKMVLLFDKSHKWQLRSYIYSAKNLYTADDDSVCDPYASVSFHSQTQQTWTCKKTLCPEWDQTLLFKDIVLYGQPTGYAENSPYVCVTLYDKHKLGKDGFLGRCFIQPTVRLQGPKGPSSRLLWHPIKRNGKECGQLLATFDLFLDEGADLPFTPPTKDNRFIVPSGIRPVIVRTGVEILCWGVRNLKKLQLANCTSPSVTIQIGNQTIKTEKIKNTKKNPNFSKNSFFLEMYLPREPIYMSPIQIILKDNRSFGRKPIIGKHVITNFNLDPPPSDDVTLISHTGNDLVDLKLTKSDFTIEVEEDSTLHSEDDDDKRLQEDDEDIHLDWWSKYYASIGDESKCGTYLTDGHKPIKIYRSALEEIEEYRGFKDFANTYLLRRGKGSEEEDGKIAGQLKGAFKIYQLPTNHHEKTSKLRYFSHKRYRATRPEDYLVRVYITRAKELAPRDSNGKSDPYLVVKLGSKKISTKERYIANELNPFFGEMFEFSCQIPITKDLKVKVMDHDLIGRDDLIGKTVIDLENRILTKARATVGLAPSYYKSGPYKWRDVFTPKELLEEYCQGKPNYISDTTFVVDGKVYHLEEFEQGDLHNNPFLGEPDQRLALHILNSQQFHGSRLTPEHVETRSLYNPMEPNMTQGELEMFVDIFPLRASLPKPPPPINITPRTSRSYELRVIIWNTADVELVDSSITGEKMTDIYVKAWLEGGKKKSMKTDTHYRSLDGEGNFNWRMMFPLDYLPEENVMVIEKKDHFWSIDKTRRYIPPKMTVQVWDQDLFSRNDFIGSLEMCLNKLPFPAQTKDDCTITMLNSRDHFIDLFKVKVCKGWWMMTGKHKKTGYVCEKGKVEMTLEILTREEADDRPCGKGRDEPNMNPTLEKPNRPQSSFLWYRNIRKAFVYVFWRRHKWFILLLIIVIILLITAVIFLYDLLGYSAKKIAGV